MNEHNFRLFCTGMVRLPSTDLHGVATDAYLVEQASGSARRRAVDSSLHAQLVEERLRRLRLELFCRWKLYFQYFFQIIDNV